MSQTKKILTSLHGRLIGLSNAGELVVKGFTVQKTNDGGAQFGNQSAPGTLDATGTLTAVLLRGGIVTSTSAAAVAATLDTGAALDTAFAGVLAANDSFEWVVINTGISALTLGASAGHTIVGNAAVATVTSARFRTRRTAANTYVTYRVA